MRYNLFSTKWNIIIGLLLWLTFISYSHYWLNTEHDSRPIITMGYMPVITNLSAPLLDYISLDAGDIRYKALKFASFAELAEALRNHEIDAAFMIAPLSIVLRQQGEDVKIVYIGNRHESTLVTRKDLNIKQLSDLQGKTIAVPMRYSGHNISILQLLEKNNLRGKIKIVEMNPPDMASALATGSLDAYYVGEPFPAQTLKNKQSSLLYYVEDVWPNFICNVMLVQQDFIERDAKTVQKLINGAARGGIWASKNTDKMAKIAAQYWNQPLELVEYALNVPKNRIRYDQFIPKVAEFTYMAELMVHFNLLTSPDIQGLVDDSFAKAVTLDKITDVSSILLTSE